MRQRRCGEALTVLQPSTIQPAAQEPGTTAPLVLDLIPPRGLTYCTCILICITYAQVMQQQFNHDVRAAEQELAAEARGGVNTTRIEALRLKMQRWPLSPASWVTVLQLPLSLTLAQPFTPARTRSRWQATYEREQGAPPSAQDTASSQVCTNVAPNPPSSITTRTLTTRTRTLAGSGQAIQVYQRLLAQLGNAVDEWAAAADVEQGVQAALHIVQQVAVRAAIAGMIVVIRECLLPLAMWITDQARAEAAEVTASTAARASARAVTGALSSIKYSLGR